jgi:hypothetical protein
MATQPTQSHIKRALHALHINVPYYRADPLPGGGIRFHLYGGRVLKWSATRASPSNPPPADDLTAIPGVGKATARALTSAGLATFDQLRAASDEVLLDLLNPGTLARLRAYLREEHPQ